MEKETLILGNNNWAVKANNLLGYAVGESSEEYVPREFTFSRNSTATYTDENGIIQTAAANIARVQDNALLLEPQRTNLLLRSEEFNNVAWITQNASVTANSIISPNGTLTADTLNVNIGGYCGIYQNISNTSATYTFSIYAKKGTKKWLFFVDLVGLDAQVWFDIELGVLGNVKPGYTATIKDVGNGWYRCSMTSTASLNIVQLGLSDSNNSANTTSSGNAYIWGAQIEVGSYTTTYIPTTTATATRLSDTFTRNNIYTNGYIGVSGGTWYVELKNNVPYLRDNGNALFIGDTTSGSTNAFNISVVSGTQRLVIYKRVAGAFTSIRTTASDNVKIAIKWNGTTADVFENGVKVVSATAFPTTLMEFLYGQNGIPVFIQSMQLYNTPLTDEELIFKTTL